MKRRTIKLLAHAIETEEDIFVYNMMSEHAREHGWESAKESFKTILSSLLRKETPSFREGRNFVILLLLIPISKIFIFY